MRWRGCGCDLMFGWFKKFRPKLEPECHWVVDLNDGEISVADDKGAMAALKLTEISKVVIETNDSGPWGADVWWLLFGQNGQLRCAYPQGATGEDDALAYILALPNFNNAEMSKAMGSTDNANFIVYQTAQ